MAVKKRTKKKLSVILSKPLGGNREKSKQRKVWFGQKRIFEKEK